MNLLNRFDQVWLVDFEFHQPDGSRPEPICMVAKEYFSGRTITAGPTELSNMERAPFDTGPLSLFVAYYTPAELSCFKVLGWNMPEHVCDLYTEFRCQTNGMRVPCGTGLLGALAYIGAPAVGEADKSAMRSIAIRGGPYTTNELTALMSYCAEDVGALVPLLEALASLLSPHSLLRGRYTKAVAHMEATGIPIDIGTLDRLQSSWANIKDALVDSLAGDTGIFNGVSFSQEGFVRYLERRNIPWPVLESGRPDLKDSTFKTMASAYPDLLPIRELRNALSQLRLTNITVGSDGRNRCMLSPFQSRTGRNQPSNAKFIFGPATYLRSLIKPAPGMALAYIDYSQQEFGIAAALSGDTAMMEAYSSGDPYLAFAKQAGAVPPDATKQSHGRERDIFKTTVLGVQYAMGAETLAARIGACPFEGHRLLALHRRIYPAFWKWSDQFVSAAMLSGRAQTRLCWQIKVGSDTNPRSLRNFPMQANGAEILRLACCYATESGISVCAPVHDALLIEAPCNEIDDAVSQTINLMRRASEDVLGGFPLASEAKIIAHPDRYMDPRGREMWETLMSLIQ